MLDLKTKCCSMPKDSILSEYCPNHQSIIDLLYLHNLESISKDVHSACPWTIWTKFGQIDLVRIELGMNWLFTTSHWWRHQGNSDQIDRNGTLILNKLDKERIDLPMTSAGQHCLKCCPPSPTLVFKWQLHRNISFSLLFLTKEI